ncbi:MAG: DUF2188 domain-containing protein, partial [Planctomycetota bacterium]
MAKKKQTASKGALVYRVLPAKDGGWEVQHPGGAVSGVFSTKEKAVAAGRKLLKKHGVGQLVVHKRDGSIAPTVSRHLDRITSDPNVCQGQPCIRYTRIQVSVLVRMVAAGMTPAGAAAEYPE